MYIIRLLYAFVKRQKQKMRIKGVFFFALREGNKPSKKRAVKGSDSHCLAKQEGIFLPCFYYVTNNPDFTRRQRTEMFSIWALQSIAK